MDRTRTSWGHVAEWYDSYMKEEGTYQRDLILPNLLRIMEIKKDDAILDVACGQGFFCREFAGAGARVTGVDVSKELIAIAKRLSPPYISYEKAPADNMAFAQPGTFDKATAILALQNIENLKGTAEECRRVLKSNGNLYIVLNHPAFRAPRTSSWGWDPKTGAQYRRIDAYLSETATKIKMHPGSQPDQVTLTFHRPLQVYMKHLTNAGFCVTRLEEWSSNRNSVGTRAEAENKARKEIPLFLFIRAAVWQQSDSRGVN